MGSKALRDKRFLVNISFLWWSVRMLSNKYRQHVEHKKRNMGGTVQGCHTGRECRAGCEQYGHGQEDEVGGAFRQEHGLVGEQADDEHGGNGETHG